MRKILCFLLLVLCGCGITEPSGGGGSGGGSPPAAPVVYNYTDNGTLIVLDESTRDPNYYVQEIHYGGSVDEDYVVFWVGNTAFATVKSLNRNKDVLPIINFQEFKVFTGVGIDTPTVKYMGHATDEFDKSLPGSFVKIETSFGILTYNLADFVQH